MSNTEIQYSLTVNTEIAYNDIRKLEIVLMRCLSFASRLTGDENLKNSLRIIEKAIMTLRTLQITIKATQLAMAGSMGPLGWAYAATSMATSGFALYDMTTGV